MTLRNEISFEIVSWFKRTSRQNSDKLICNTFFETFDDLRRFKLLRKFSFGFYGTIANLIMLFSAIFNICYLLKTILLSYCFESFTIKHFILANKRLLKKNLSNKQRSMKTKKISVFLFMLWPHYFECFERKLHRPGHNFLPTEFLWVQLVFAFKK